jgi:hypothetical protein
MDIDDINTCEYCELDPEECGRDPSDCGWEIAGELYEQRREL